MKSPMTYEQFLTAYGTKCGRDVDIALLNLFMAFKKDIKPVFEEDYDRFQKMFRIIDVCSVRGVDNAIWHLMNESKLIWEVLV